MMSADTQIAEALHRWRRPQVPNPSESICGYARGACSPDDGFVDPIPIANALAAA